MITDLRPYSEMKDSGVEWIGAVPKHWDVRRTKWLLSRNDSGTWGSDFDDHGIIVLRSTEQKISGEWNILAPARRRLSPSEYAACRLEEGDLLVTKSSGSQLHIGKTSIVTRDVADLDCCFSNFMQRLRVDRNAMPRFLWYVFNGNLGRSQLDYYSDTTTGLANLNGEIIGNVTLAVPPLAEQFAIARFLDHADRLIRRYIRTKQKLVELLLEQKQATTHQAVTGQIDARTGQRYSAYKSSGVEWLGKVPEHWEISRVKNEFHCLNRHRLPLNSPERGLMTGRQYDYYGASGVIDKVDDYLFDDELLLLAEDGANLVLRNLPLAIIARGKFWVNNHAHILKPKRGHLEFLSGVMEGLNYLPWISGAAQPKLTKDRLMSIAIAVPTLKEQQSFVTSVTDATYHLRRAIFLERRQIELLREYRTRLISDAVTGKIDVREATVGAKGDPNE